jgi:hypothetical protein
VKAYPSVCPGTPHRGHLRPVDACSLDIATRRGERSPSAHAKVDARDVKDIYENIDVVLSAMNGHEACGRSGERENLEWLAELVKALTGLNSNGHLNDDTARTGRAAALQWLRAVGYITR